MFTTIGNYKYEMNFEKLKKYITEERLSLYLQYTNNDIEKAITLYNLNLEMSCAFSYPISMLEIMLRNSVNEVLTREYGDEWYDNKFILPKNALAIDSIKKFLISENKEINNSNIVSNSTMGVWVEFFHTKYTNTLGGKLNVIFASKKYPNNVYNSLLTIKNKIRNKISHNGNIIKTDLLRNYGLLSQFTTFIDRETADYITHNSKIKEIYEKNKSVLLSFHKFCLSIGQ